MKEKLLNVAVVVSLTCAAIITAMVIRREIFSPSPPPVGPPRPVVVEGWATYGERGQRIGQIPDAPVRIVEFSDFQCPFCARFEESLDSIRARYPGKVEVIFRHYPIEAIHPEARLAAEASECAGEQGRFEAFHRALFSAQREIGVTPWTEFARRAAVPDTVALIECIASGRQRARIEEDRASAKTLGIDGTPTVLINQWKVEGALPLPMLDSLVGSLLQESSKR